MRESFACEFPIKSADLFSMPPQPQMCWSIHKNVSYPTLQYLSEYYVAARMLLLHAAACHKFITYRHTS